MSSAKVKAQKIIDENAVGRSSIALQCWTKTEAAKLQINRSLIFNLL